ncbi:hypothetical protein OG799_25280 [Micromonospora sp. NBC_00898]|nr:hypothetical protein OG799_25280 [Micromonospora sp. NBC_00898]
MEGLGVYLLGGHYPPETALAALDAQLDLVFHQDEPGQRPARAGPLSRAG